MEIIFEPFTRLAAGGQLVEGVGLGLSITRQLVSLMMGTISVRSEEGKGSTFTVDLPLPTAGNEEIAAERIEPVVTGYLGSHKKILVVDDNVINSMVLVSLLEPLEFEVFVAASGEEAVKQANGLNPDLILLDLKMPGMDGLDVAKEIQRLHNLQHIRIIGISATASFSERKREFLQVCDDFVTKPYDEKILLEKIREQLLIEWVTEDLEISKAGRASDEDIRMPVSAPPREIIEALQLHVDLGNYNGLEEIIATLQTQNPEYESFCSYIRKYIPTYDDEGISKYLKTLIEGPDDRKE